MKIDAALKNQSIVATKQSQEGTIGDLFWYSIGSQLIERQELTTKFNDAAMDYSWLPNEIRISDAFRRATREIQRKKVPTSDTKVFLNFLTREVYSDSDSIQRNIVIEQVDQSGKRLDYNSTATVIQFDKKDVSIKIMAQDGEDQARDLAEEAKERFYQYTKFYAAQNLRVMVAKILSSFAPTQVRPNGGVYFVPKTYHDDLTKLTTLVNLLENSEAYTIPLFDTKDNRGMVNRKLHEEMISVLKGCDSILYADTVPPSKIKEAIDEAKRVANTFKTYQSVVSLDIEVLNESLLKLKEKSMTLVKKLV
jgi:hypothetical protein